MKVGLMSIRFKLTFLLLVLFIVSLSNSILTFKLEGYSEEKLNWINHTNKVLKISEQFLSSMKDTETGQRGYLLTSDSSYLEPYHHGIIEAKRYLQELMNLTIERPKQQFFILNIEQLMNKKFEELEETIKLVHEGKKSDALDIVRKNRGKELMDQIRRKIVVFNNSELILLEKRKGDFREGRAQITTLIAVETILLISLSIITISFLRRSFFSPLKLLLQSTKKIKSGEKVEVHDILSKDEMGNLLSTFYAMSQSVAQREKDLDYKAHHDELTGLKNRTTLIEEMNKSIEYSALSGENLAVLYIDLNEFKKINDTLGHDSGDLILKETALRLNSSVRSSDMVFRVGGDEFIVLAKNIGSIENVKRLIGKIIHSFQSPIVIQGKQKAFSISLGAAILPNDSSNSEEIIRFADIAMFCAKRDESTHAKIFNKDMLKRSSDFK